MPVRYPFPRRIHLHHTSHHLLSFLNPDFALDARTGPSQSTRAAEPLTRDEEGRGRFDAKSEGPAGCMDELFKEENVRHSSSNLAV